MISDYLSLFCIVDHVDMAVILNIWVPCVLTIDLDCLVDGIADSVHGQALRWVSDTHVLLIFASIKFDQRGTISTIKAWMFTSAELIELIDNTI